MPWAAAEKSARMVITGQSGNYSFSPCFPPSGVRRSLARTPRKAGQVMDTPDRDEFLAHLAGHEWANVGILNPAGLGGLLHADPYRARPLLDLAAILRDSDTVADLEICAL